MQRPRNRQIQHKSRHSPNIRNINNFSPWEIVRLYYAISRILEEDGILISDEAYRTYLIYHLQGYKQILVEKCANKNIIISIHKEYNIKKEQIKRLLINLTTGETYTIKIKLWDIATLAAIQWIFFKNIDLIEETETRGLLIAKQPRKTIKETYTRTPRMLKHN